jgi:hypothetical protein
MAVKQFLNGIVVLVAASQPDDFALGGEPYSAAMSAESESGETIVKPLSLANCGHRLHPDEAGEPGSSREINPPAARTV